MGMGIRETSYVQNSTIASTSQAEVTTITTVAM